MLTTAATLLLLAASPSGAPAQKDDGFQIIHVTQLQTLLSDKAQPIELFDANGDDFRKKEGVIPGAKLLSDSSAYDLAVLPKDKAEHVVFYCGNAKCMASHDAAKRAVKAGYTEVAVLGDGLLGWKEAGKPVSKP